MTITKRGRFWAVFDPEGALVCLTVYKKGAREVLRRLQLNEDKSAGEGEPSASSPAALSPSPTSVHERNPPSWPLPPN